ncbi:hypothetical protein [Streptomyces sp. NRRL B-24484]|uniref:hypothetical protein n=1 Tax=Streptomyces sp. NRRL B-24484 TaxID=1463833 RepID=UPI0004BF7ACB|nr:hypothetical protein [Streptomyces sp. NRRL B-24484]
MLAEAFMALASAAGAAVAQAAGTDLWTGFRKQVVSIFGLRGAQDAQVVLERLDRAATELDRASPEEAEQVRTGLKASWQDRFEDLLESLGEDEREKAAGQLGELVASVRREAGGVSAGKHGLAIDGNVSIVANHGVAAGQIRGDVTLGNPPQPGPN